MDDAEACRRKMINATALIEGLSGERIRWTEASKGFEAQIHRLVGDVLLCTGFLSYTGPFNQEFRNLVLKGWKKEMIANKIPFSDASIFYNNFFLIFCWLSLVYIIFCLFTHNFFFYLRFFIFQKKRTYFRFLNSFRCWSLNEKNSVISVLTCPWIRPDSWNVGYIVIMSNIYYTIH